MTGEESGFENREKYVKKNINSQNSTRIYKHALLKGHEWSVLRPDKNMIKLFYHVFWPASQ